MLDNIREYMTAVAGLDEGQTEKAVFALTEILLNAVEHGNLGIEKETKNLLIEKGRFDAVVAELEETEENREKAVQVTLGRILLEGRECFVAVVADHGEGFNAPEMFKSLNFPNTTAFNGRGILMSEMVADGLFYNRKGNHATLYILREPMA